MEHEKVAAQLDIRTVVLVGRQDFGRCPLAARRPSALWSIVGKPALSRLLDHLAAEGIRSAVVCCGDDVLAPVEAACDGTTLDVKVLTEDLTKGTAGCLRDAVASDRGDLLMVLSGSMVSPPSVSLLTEAHRASGAELTMVFNPGRPNDLSHGSPAEIYLCKPDVLRHIPGGGYSDIKEGLIPSILRAGGTVRPMVLPKEVGNFHDREGYLCAMSVYLKNGKGFDDGPTLYDRSDGRVVSMIPGVSVHPTARIYGPVAIADEARLLEGAVVVGPAVVGRRAVVGRNSVIVRSAVWEYAEVGGQCEIRESIVDQGVEVPDGAVVVEQTVSGGGWPAKGAARSGAVRSTSTRIEEISSRRAAYVCGGVAVLLAFLWSYWPTLTELWGIWQRSEEYSAGLLVPFLAAYVLWSRRREIAHLVVRPAILSGIVVFLLAQTMRRLGLYHMYASGERLSMVLSLTAIVVLLFGWRFLWKLAPILLFLCLTLPWPNRIQTRISLPLQDWATSSAVFCLELAGYDVLKDGNVIRIGDTSVAVAEACNGLRMITAFIVISGLVVLLARRAWWEKLLVLVSSLPIALLCNTLRLTVTAVFFTMLEGENWEKLFHDFGGYAMMPLALALMVGELWLLARLTTQPAEIEPEIIARNGPRHEPDS